MRETKGLADQNDQEKPAHLGPSDGSQVHDAKPMCETHGASQRQRRGQVQDEQKTPGEVFTTQNVPRFPKIMKEKRIQRGLLPDRIDKHVPREGNEIAATSEHEPDARRDKGAVIRAKAAMDCGVDSTLTRKGAKLVYKILR